MDFKFVVRFTLIYCMFLLGLSSQAMAFEVSLCGSSHEWVDVTGDEYWTSYSVETPTPMWSGSAWVLGTGGDSLEVKLFWNVEFKPEAIRITGDSQGDTLYSSIALVNGSTINLPNNIWNESQPLDLSEDIQSLVFNTYSGGQKTITKIEFLCPGTPDVFPPEFTEYSPQNGQIINDLHFMINISDSGSGVNWSKTVSEGNSVVNLDTGESVVGGSWFSSDGLHLEYQSPVSLVDGNYRFIMTAEDNAGNIDTHQLDVTVDTTPPVVSAIWSSGLAGPVYSPNVYIYGVASENIIIDSFYSPDTSVSYPAVYYEGDGWSVTVPDLVPGQNNFLLVVHDAANNQTTLPITVEYVLPIEKPQNTFPVEGGTIYSTTPILTASVYSNINTIPQQASQWKIWGEAEAFDSGVVGPEVSHEYTVPVEANLAFDIPYQWKVRYQDTNGSWSDWSDSTSFTIVLDDTPPDLSSLPTEIVIAANQNEIVFTLEADVSVNAYLSGEVPLPAVVEGQEWTISVDAAAEGFNHIDLFVEDLAGNQSSTSISLYRDILGPELSFLDFSDGSLLTLSPQSIRVEVDDLYSDIALDSIAKTVSVVNENGASILVDGVWEQTTHDALHGLILTFTPTETLSDGEYKVVVTAADNLANSSTVNLSFTIDTTPPDPPAFAPYSTLINNDNIILTGSKTADSATVVVSSTGGTLGAVSYPTDLTWQVLLSGLTDGNYTLSTHALDAAGHQSGTVQGPLVVDQTPPMVSIDPVSSSTTEGMLTVEGTKEINSDLYLDGQLQGGFFATSIWSVDVVLSTEGENYYNFNTQDLAGNVSDPVQITIVRDTQGPVLTLASPDVSGIVNFANSLNITFNDQWSDVDYTASLSGAELRNSTSVVAGEWTTDGSQITFLPIQALSNGQYTVNLSPIDSLGNSSVVAFVFNVDQVAPSVSSLSMTPDSPHQAETVVFTIEFDEAMDTSVVLDATIDGVNLYPLSGDWLNSTRWQGTYTFTDQTGDGPYTVSVSAARDIAGNELALQQVSSFVLDTVAPAVPVVTSVPPVGTNQPTLPLMGTGEAGSQIVINGIVCTTIDDSGNWTYNYSLKEGNNSFTVVARDAAGNDSAPVASLPTTVLDTTPPIFTIDPTPAVSAEQTLLVTGTREAGAVLKLDGVEFADQDGDGDDTTWAFSLTLQGTGLQESYIFSATDAQQNSVERTLTTTYDAAAPVALASGALQVDGNGNGQQVRLSWLYEEPIDLAYYRIYVDQNEITDLSGLTSVGTVNRGTKTFTVNGLTAGTTYHFAVEPVDGIGNSEKSPVVSVAATPIDVEAPENISSLTATVRYNGENDNSVTLRWTASTDSMGDLADQVLYTDDGNGYDTGTSLGSAVVEHQVPGLADNKTYKFKITTKDNGDHESAGVYTTVATALNNPQGLTADPSKNKVTLSWQPVSSADLILYKIYRQESAQPFTDVGSLVPIDGVTGTGYVDNNLTNGTVYQYAVTAVNSFGAEKTLVSSIAATPREDETGPDINGPLIAEGSVPLRENHVLTEPLTLSASATDSESAIGLVKIFVDDVEVASNTGSANYFWNLVATADGTHSVKVQAFDSVGNMTELTRSVEVSLAAPSSDPADLKITTPENNARPTTDTILIAGVAPQFTTLTLKVNGTVAGTEDVGILGVFSFSDVPLVSGTNTLQIMAAHRGGESAYSDPIQIIYDTGAPPAPTVLTAQALAGGKLQFSWQAGDGETPTGYNLYVADESFTDVAQLTPVNGATAIHYLFKEYQPVDDASRYYGVTALDGSGNESPLSELVQIASDRSAPQLFGDPAFIVVNRAANGAVGPGEVTVNLEVTEPLSEIPFFSLEPTNGSPIIIPLESDPDGLAYHGSFQITALSPHGPTTFNLSTKDFVGNRNTLTGPALTLDTRGPQATITGLEELQEAVGTAAITLSFDEVPQEIPTMQLRDSHGAEVDVPLTAVDSQTWNGSLNLEGLAAGYAGFQLGSALTDELGNSSNAIVSGGGTQLYVGAPPAPSAPAQLAATTRGAGEISLVWQGVQQAGGYRLYRRPAGGSDLDWQQVGSDLPGTANHYDDLPPTDGFYEFAVTALGLLSSESDRSPIANAESDRTPPAIPDGLSLTLSGDGVLAAWNAAADAYGYRLYQHDGTGKGPRVAETLSRQAIDPSPANNPQSYVVTAVDTLGNESASSTPQQIAFDVAPPSSLTVKQSEGGKPELTWTGTGVGYFIYRNGSRINSMPTGVTSYTDIYYNGEAVTYGVSLVDDNNYESPIRELTLPNLQIGLPEGTSLRRGILETIPVVLRADTDLSVTEVKLQVGTYTASTVVGPYAVTDGQETTVEKVAAAGLDAGSTVGVLCTAVLEPSAGSRIEISRTSTARVEGSGTSLEIYNQPLVRGTATEVRIKINNLGSARMDLVTSRNGGASDQIRVLLKDEDGNLLGQGQLNQRSGTQVLDSGGYATARIEPGTSFLSLPISIQVPESAPYKVIIEAQIDNTYYHYGQTDQVVAPGLQQKLTTTIADVSYQPTVQLERAANAQGDKIFTQGEAVLISGEVAATTDGSPVPHVPVQIGIAVNGFDRFYTVSSDASGQFSYNFQPGSGEVGHYTVWSNHPDLSDRSVQDSFDIIAMRLSPESYNLKLARGGSYSIPVKLTNLSGAELTDLTLTSTASSGLSVDQSRLPVNGSSLSGGKTLSFSLSISADDQAPATGTATLTIETAQGLSRKLTVNVNCYDNIPIIGTSPSYIDAGLKRGSQQIKTFTVTNRGLAELQNARITAPSLSWIKLAVDPGLGNLAVNESRSVGLLIQPGAQLAPGSYTDRVVIESDNHIPYSYNISVTVTSDAIGSVLFDVVDELTDDNGNYRDVVGASITLQNQAQPQLIYSLKTNNQGTASKTDIPEGRYSYTISAAGHKGYSGTLTVAAGLTVAVPIALEVTLVEVEWSVTEVVIDDRYEIVIKQTFETNVPTSVLVVEPPGVNIPDIQPGEVYNGEFSITNYGLIAAKFKGVNAPSTIDDYEIELLGTIPAELTANQRVVVPYRVTRKPE